jgi:DNA-binding NarL/FixJ family response regulator
VIRAADPARPSAAGAGTDVRVLVVDDQDLVRAGFRTILESEEGIEVVGEAANGADAITQTRRLEPDLVCMDVQMPGMDGLEATRLITADPDIDAAVLVLTTFHREDYLFTALQAGASGFLLKNSSPEKLIEAVQVVARGDALLSPDVTRRVIEAARTTGATESTKEEVIAPPPEAPAEIVDPALGALTEREREVLQLLAEGLSNTEIAARMYVGEATVKTHVSKVLMKLGLRDRVHAVVYAYERGVVQPGT